MNKLKIKDRNLDIKAHFLRNHGLVPGTIYGPSIQDSPIKISTKELKKVIQKDGEVYEVMSKSGPVFVKIEEVQKDPFTQDIIHFSLVEMPKGKESDIEVPINLTGVPVGVKKGGTLVMIKDEITVHGKPLAIPTKFEADISNLKIGEKLTVDDLKIPKKVDSLDDEEDIIAICKPPVKEMVTTDNEFAIEENTLVETQTI